MDNINLLKPKVIEKPIIKRELRGSGYRWEMRGNRFVVIDTKKNIEIILTKVGAMSLIKFLPNYLDKMRIEENKLHRLKLQLIKQNQRDNKLKRQFAKGNAKKYKGLSNISIETKINKTIQS